ncbi:hypothetical protein BG74_06950 [Sodalis-like endosymbiont of Proechinophthirus fluctus]|uniref:DegT/DnrJ/EryC1/StrS family aminotransferase n=1 Tax=Sodalis-like endosymbiont of Proechinophthirus fluctus TaxID=1462730 RepID=UPI0007A8F91B|nr:hypothetical protein BG74_06950 [Sodalis-like endosymbiont of Proechinophthirus fluctus]
MSSFIFYTSANAIILARAKIVFVNFCPDTYNISIIDLMQKITNQTEAILAVQIFDVPEDCLALEKIAKVHNIKLILDSVDGMG